MKHARLLFVLFAFLLSNTAFAAWQMEVQKKDGSWEPELKPGTRMAILETVHALCYEKTPRRMVETSTGEINWFECSPTGERPKVTSTPPKNLKSPR